MASVKLFPNSAHWYACFKLPTGQTDSKGRAVFRRVQRSTGTKEKGKAQQIAIAYERAAVAAAEKRWTENTARRFLAELSALTGISAAQAEPIDQYLRRWLKGRRSSLSADSFTRYEVVIDHFLAFLGGEAAAPLADLSPVMVAKFRDAEAATGKSITTVNKALAVLGQAFAEAVTMRLLETNPARGLNMKGEKRSAQKREAFTFEQFALLVARTAPAYVASLPVKRSDAADKRANSPEWQTLVMLAGYTGGRQQELAQLQWRDVVLGESRVKLGRTKTGDAHWMPLHPSLKKYLEKIRAEKPDAVRLMPFLAALGRRQISKVFRDEILPRAGIVQPYGGKEGKGRELGKFSLHSLRHSLSTWLNEAGVSEMMRMRLVGHEDEDVSRGYTHTELSQAAKELSKVPAL